MRLRAKLSEWARRSSPVLQAWAAREEGRFILAVPWLMAAGIIAGSAWGGPAPTGVAVAAAMSAGFGALSVTRGTTLLGSLSKALFFIALGGVLIGMRLMLVASPLVPPGDAPRMVTGQIETIELREKDRRLTIRPDTIEGVAEEDLPYRVRVVWRGAPADVMPGDLVRIPSVLSPPPGPVVPGGYDFGQSLKFQRIGGVGYALAPPSTLSREKRSLTAHIETLREQMADRIESRVGGPEGAVAAALVTGKRERIPEAVIEALRDAGLAHLLAISGLHMGLVCGFLFWTVRAGLVLHEPFALKLPVKKIAAAAALIGGLTYLSISGMAWSAQRAFIMAAVVFGAILFDRRGISLRNAAIAAVLILTIRPEAVLTPGFQMSFAAVLVLVSAFSAIEERREGRPARGPMHKVAGFFGGLALTSLLAGLATAPFAVHHFGQLARYGLLGNLLAMPLVTLAIMPALVVAVLLMPLGLDGPILFLIGNGIGFLLRAATFTAELPGSVLYFPPLAPWALMTAVVGGLVLTLLAAPWRLLGLVPILVAFGTGFEEERAEIYLSRDLSNVAMRLTGTEAELALLTSRRDRFTVEAWLSRLAVPRDVDRQALFEVCERNGCFHFLADGGRVSVIESRAALMRTCRRSRVVILRARTYPEDYLSCRALLIGLDRNGEMAPATLSLTPKGWVLTTPRQAGGFSANIM